MALPPTLRRLPAAIVIVALVLGSMSMFAASAPAVEPEEADQRLASARAELLVLEERLEHTRAEGRELEERLAWVEGLTMESQSRYDELSAQLASSEQDIRRSVEHVTDLQQRFDAVIRSSYIDGGASPLTVLMEEDDSAIAQTKMLFLHEVATHQIDLARETSEARESLEAQSAVTSSLQREQRSLLMEMRDSRNDLIAQNDDLAQALENIDDAREELLETVERLKGMLTQTDLERIQEALKGKKSVTYGQWAKLALAKLQAPICKENQIVMIAWQANEGTDAQWNPLATTYDMPGATEFNWVGVRNYVSLAQGLQATELTLKRGWDSYGYGEIVKSLRRCGKAEDTATHIAASSWCGCGSYYVYDLVDNVRGSFNYYSRI